MPDEPVRVPPPTYNDDRYPLPPDERGIGVIRLPGTRWEPLWPEDFYEDQDDAEEQARREQDRDTIAALSEELHQLRQEGSDDR